MSRVNELLIGAIIGRKTRQERKEQRQARRQARQTTPSPIAPRVTARFYARIAKFGAYKDPKNAGYVFNLRGTSYAEALAHFKSLYGWDEVKAMRGEIVPPTVNVYEMWDASKARPVMLHRWDTTMIDREKQRQWLAMYQR